MLKDILDQRMDLQQFLFRKGFLISDNTELDLTLFPFYNNWRTVKHGNFFIYTHKDVSLFTYIENNDMYFLIGHAYNPFSLEIDENCILRRIAEECKNGGRPEYIDELTGVFILGKTDGTTITVELDCSGMQYGCYGCIDGKVYIASHMQLIGDICGLKTDDYVTKLVHYRWYHYMMGNYMPGDLTCFKEVKRIIPNTFIRIENQKASIARFYPSRSINACKTAEEYEAVLHEAADIMQKTMALIPQKWKRPAISLTGGIDSNTTFAAASGNYDKYETFSYVSMFRESIDAEAAKTISEHFHVPHKVYTVPDSNEEVKDFEIFKMIFTHNDGEIGTLKDDDTRKKIVLINNDVCDVEVKSWISETIRAYAYKYFGRKKMPKKLKPRNYTSLYKIFFMNRKLVWETDRYFDEYIKSTKLKEHLFNYDESDFFVWEMMHGGKCGLDIGVMKLCFDITIPYNNRKLLDLLLRVPLDKRISDQHHMDLKRIMNKELFDMNIRVVNLNETSTRAFLLNVIFQLNSILPF